MNTSKHLKAAIDNLHSDILDLEVKGTRPGFIGESHTGKNYKQYHWCHDGKRQYLKKSLVPSVQAECDRYQEVQRIKKQIELIEQALQLVQVEVQRRADADAIERLEQLQSLAATIEAEQDEDSAPPATQAKKPQTREELEAERERLLALDCSKMSYDERRKRDADLIWVGQSLNAIPKKQTIRWDKQSASDIKASLASTPEPKPEPRVIANGKYKPDIDAILKLGVS